jgi:hypothetical protein
MKPRISQILAISLFCGLGVGALTWKLAGPARNASVASSDSSYNQEAAKSSRDVDAERVSRVRSVASKHDAEQPDPLFASVAPELRESLWNGVSWDRTNPADLLDSQLGDEIALDMGNGLTLRGEVTVKKETNGSRLVGVTLSEPQATFYVHLNGSNQLLADLDFKGSTSIYRWTGLADSLVLKRMPQNEVLCASLTNNDIRRGFPLHEAALQAAPGPEGEGSVIAAAPLGFDSKPGSAGCIYLDFDGQTVTNTRWNVGGISTIVALPAPYSSAEIETVWKTVAEDYAPFNVTVTTDESVYNTYAVGRRIRVIFSPTFEWYGLAGGVAYLQSFNDGLDEPCWVFTPLVGDYLGAAECASHEAGHTLGLLHDGTDDGTIQEEYYLGTDAWAPIMGAGYYSAVAQFSKGEYPDANNTEDDLAIIAGVLNGLNYRKDDLGPDDLGHARVLYNKAGGGINEVGMIGVNLDNSDNPTADIDLFSFRTSGGNCQFVVTDAGKVGNLNVRLAILDANGLEVDSANPNFDRGAILDRNLAAGRYYLSISGDAEGDSYTAYGSLGAYILTGTVPGLGAGIPEITSPSVQAVSIREGHGVDLVAKVIGHTPNTTVLWSQAEGPVGGETTFTKPTSLTTKATFSQPGEYRIRITASVGDLSAEAEVSISVESEGDEQVYPNMGPILVMNAESEIYSFSTFVNGSISHDNVPSKVLPSPRWDIIQGSGLVTAATKASTPVSFNARGTHTMAFSASDGEVRTFIARDITVSATKINPVKRGSAGKLLVPTSNAVDGLWTQPLFDDSSWTPAKVAFGYHTASGYAVDLVGGTDVKNALYQKGTSVYMRLPFEAPSGNFVTAMKLVLKLDDGFVLHLNGTEIMRRNVAATGPLAWNATATSKRTATDIASLIELDLMAHRHLLVEGTNLLAIHALNSAKNDTTFLFSPSLEIQEADTDYVSGFSGLGLAAAMVAPNADADGDGVPNIIEHAMGTSPVTVQSPEPVLKPKSGGAVEMTLPLDPPAHATYILEQTFDLSHWTEVAKKNGKGEWALTGVSLVEVGSAPPFKTIRFVPVGKADGVFYRMRFKLDGPY